MPAETFSMRVEVGSLVHDGTLSLDNGRVSGMIDGTAIEGTYNRDGESFAVEIHGAQSGDGADPFGPGRPTATLSGTLATDPSHLTGTTGHEDGINVKATLHRQQA